MRFCGPSTLMGFSLGMASLKFLIVSMTQFMCMFNSFWKTPSNMYPFFSRFSSRQQLCGWKGFNHTFFLLSRRILSFVSVRLWPVGLVLVSLLSCGKCMSPRLSILCPLSVPQCVAFMKGLHLASCAYLAYTRQPRGLLRSNTGICSQVWLSPDLPGWSMVSPATCQVLRAKSTWNMMHFQCFCLNAANLKTALPLKKTQLWLGADPA